MRVDFKFPWFAPGGDIVKDKRPFKGRLFRRGVQNVPEELRDILPKSARIMDENTTKKVLSAKPELPRLADFDLDRAAADDEKEVHNKVNARRQTT